MVFIQTLESLFKRYGFKLVDYMYCSRRKYENILASSHIKHTTINAKFD